MTELLSYLREHGYKTYIVTGFGQDFVRVYSEKVYGIPPEQVVGSALATQYGYAKDGTPELIKIRNYVERQRRRQTRRHPSDHRPASAGGLRQLDRR